MSELAKWDSFYVIVGSAAGALIGLQFVVVTLIAQRPALRVAQAGSAFATPTIVHFGTALFLSAVLRVPWRSIIPAATIWGIIGCAGVAYAVVVARRVRAQAVYEQSSKTGPFTFCCRWRHTRRSPWRRSRLPPIRERPCLLLEVRRCCYSSPAFTMPGTASPTMHLRARRKHTPSGMTIRPLFRNERCSEWTRFRARLTYDLCVPEASTLHSSSSSTTFWSLWLRIS